MCGSPLARLQQINVAGISARSISLSSKLISGRHKPAMPLAERERLVEALKRALKESTAELLAGRVASLPEIENLERRLESAMERTDGLLEVSASTAELIEQLLAVIASERSIDPQGSSDLMAAIRSTRESLANASERLADVRRRLAEIRQKRGVDVNLSEIAKLSLGVVAKLDVVQSQIDLFRKRLDETRSRSAQLQNRIRSWILAGECLILLLIAWVGSGQFCLLLQGRRLLPSNACGPRTTPRMVALVELPLGSHYDRRPLPWTALQRLKSLRPR